MKKVTSILLATALVLSVMLTGGAQTAAAAQAQGETKVNSNDFGDITIPNVVKVGYAAYSGSYEVGYDEEKDEEIYQTYDPTGWEGYVFNDSVGLPVYYVAGDSVTVTVSGEIFENGAWIRLIHEADGTFSFDAEMAHPVSPQGPALKVTGTGFAKYTLDWDALHRLWNGETNIDGIIQGNGTTATLTKGVWQAPGIQDFSPCLIAVGLDESSAAAPSTSFSDVAATAYYANPVAWAVEQGITNGTGANTFSPEQTCTKAQIITFLWRAAGSPEPKSLSHFSDVKSDAYYAKATAWAAENGMTSGGTFSPNAPCTREMAVEFMWKHAGSPSAAQANFTDVSSGAVNWAVEKGVTNGTGANTFSPDTICTRGQIVTFLYRAFAE